MATQATTVQITMPAMGESVTEGTVLEWLKQVGDAVSADEPLVEVSTDKVDAEVPAPATGTLVRILVEADQTVQVGAPLGEIEVGDAPHRRRRRAGPRAARGNGAAADDDGELVDVAFPEMGDSVAEGTVLEWRKQVGDAVAVDDILVEISTDKVDAELPSPVAGTLSEILVQADETVAVGTTLCRIAAGAGAAPAARRPRGPGRGAQGHAARRGAPHRAARSGHARGGARGERPRTGRLERPAAAARAGA